MCLVYLDMTSMTIPWFHKESVKGRHPERVTEYSPSSYRHHINPVRHLWNLSWSIHTEWLLHLWKTEPVIPPSRHRASVPSVNVYTFWLAIDFINIIKYILGTKEICGQYFIWLLYSTQKSHVSCLILNNSWMYPVSKKVPIATNSPIDFCCIREVWCKSSARLLLDVLEK